MTGRGGSPGLHWLSLTPGVVEGGDHISSNLQHLAQPH